MLQSPDSGLELHLPQLSLAHSPCALLACRLKCFGHVVSFALCSCHFGCGTCGVWRVCVCLWHVSSGRPTALFTLQTCNLPHLAYKHRPPPSLYLPSLSCDIVNVIARNKLSTHHANAPLKKERKRAHTQLGGSLQLTYHYMHTHTHIQLIRVTRTFILRLNSISGSIAGN